MEEQELGSAKSQLIVVRDQFDTKKVARSTSYAYDDLYDAQVDNMTPMQSSKELYQQSETQF